jgi:hypothetical protein
MSWSSSAVAVMPSCAARPARRLFAASLIRKDVLLAMVTSVRHQSLYRSVALMSYIRAEPGRRSDAGAAAAAERVTDRQRSIGSRGHDHQRRDTKKGYELTVVVEPIVAALASALPAFPRATSAMLRLRRCGDMWAASSLAGEVGRVRCG